MTSTFRIAVIPGDGIGKEVMPEGVRVLDAAAQTLRAADCSGSRSTGRAATAMPNTAR